VVRFDAPFTRAAQPPPPSAARSEPQANGVIAQAPRSGARSEPQASEVIETGWRIAREHWGRGYAPEAARAALAFGFERLGLAEIVSFTAVGNVRSRRVMEKIGMAHDPAGDFEHPGLPPGHRLRRHVLYRIRAAQRRST
jgi:RimJ/RimL family protein N-acetyltransferase